jgi:hypothetical protein
MTIFFGWKTPHVEILVMVNPLGIAQAWAFLLKY